MTAGEESDVIFLRWIWRAAHKRHGVFDAVLDDEIGYGAKSAQLYIRSPGFRRWA
jgi:hypothetical protein